MRICNYKKRRRKLLRKRRRNYSRVIEDQGGREFSRRHCIQLMKGRYWHKLVLRSNREGNKSLGQR
jgi:hypothetical protein